MRGSLKIFAFAKIPVYVHWSFALLGIYVAYYGHSSGLKPAAFIVFGFLFFALFVCVILHEYGHALMARRFGIPTRDIILLPLGGIARLEKIPEKPLHEFLVAAAGPAVNFLIALSLGIILYLDDTDGLGRLTRGGSLILEWGKVVPLLFIVNISLGVLNLAPAFPLDGGRMFRALLAMFLKRETATKIASGIGQVLAVSMVGWGIYGNDFMLMAVGAFIFLGARSEYRSASIKAILTQKTVRELTKRSYPVVFEHNNIDLFLKQLPTKPSNDVLVLKEDQTTVAGILTVPQIMDLKKQDVAWQDIGSHLTPDFPRIDANENAWTGLEQLRKSTLSFLPVFERERFLGVVDYDGINKGISAK